MVAVGEHARLEHLDGGVAHLRLRQLLGVHLVDGDLRPDEHPEAVGLLERVRVQRVVRADERRAEVARPGELLVARGVVDREAARARVLLEADAADVQRAAVQHQAPVRDLDRAHADRAAERLQRPLARTARAASRRRGTGGPATTAAACATRMRWVSVAEDFGPSATRPSRTLRAPKRPDDRDRARRQAGVAHADVPGDRRRARRARQVRAARPPCRSRCRRSRAGRPRAGCRRSSTSRRAGGRARRTSPAGSRCAVRRLSTRRTRRLTPGALEEAARQAQLERQVGAVVLPDEAAVEPDRDAVVDRLEARGPHQRLALGRQPEVLAVPADGAGERRGALVGRVPGVRARSSRSSRRSTGRAASPGRRR